MAYNYSTKSCQYCNKTFKPVYPRQIYCSIPCRFWSKVRVNNIDDCWEWKASLDSRGYGQFRMNKKEKRAYRLAYEFTCGKIKNGLHVLHKCDNKLCCNPTHLYIGTHQDNMADAVNRKRMHKGYKLSVEDIHNIRAMCDKNIKYKEIANFYNIHPCHISRIKNGKRWDRY